MYIPFRVAITRVDFHKHSAWGNHTGDIDVKEGRTRPAHACLQAPRHIHSLTRPETAKTASSQGEALALIGRDQTHNETQLKDMKMEFYS